MFTMLVIDTKDASRKLLELDKHMAHANEVHRQYARRLAVKLNPELNQLGFAIAAMAALDEFQHEDRNGYPPVMFNLLRSSIPDVAKAVCPAEFAEAVAEVFAMAETEVSKASQS